MIRSSRKDIAFFCRDGHVTPVDMADEGERLWRYKCRRQNPAYAMRTQDRCHEPVKILAEYPAVEAAYKVGGEQAVIEMAHMWQTWDW